MLVCPSMRVKVEQMEMMKKDADRCMFIKTINRRLETTLYNEIDVHKDSDWVEDGTNIWTGSCRPPRLWQNYLLHRYGRISSLARARSICD